jgi:glycosyltransferase involved in cell wall biosynthesis
VPQIEPTAVFGVPLYNHAPYLEEALTSILGQSRDDLAVVLVDDCSDDGTREIAEAFAARDVRVSYIRNEQRLGLVGNWRRAHLLAREAHPTARYFAWGSDHDRWHPDWLAKLVSELEANPDVVLTYPISARLTAQGEEQPRKRPSAFQTLGVKSGLRRFMSTVVAAPAGSFVYGLYRIDALERAGVLRDVLAPDRLLLAELSLQGEFALVPELLWWRRFKVNVTDSRQRRAFYPVGAPLRSHAPWCVQHTAALGWRLGMQGGGRPSVSRAYGLGAAALYIPLAFGRTMRKHGRRSLRRLRRTKSRIRARAGELVRSRRRG